MAGYGPRPLRERFEEKVEFAAPTECWVWTGSLTKAGYGQVYDGRPRGAHRVAYELYVGPIPKGKQLDHLCRNRACVNPAHLEPVSNARNAQRGKRAKLSMRAARRIRQMRRNGWPLTKLMRHFDVSMPVIDGAAKGVRWAEEEFEVPDAFRQSILATFDECWLSARFDLEGYYDSSSPPQARGILFHRVAHETLATLWRQGEESIPVAEGLEVMYEVCRQAEEALEDVVLLTAAERRNLRIEVIRFCTHYTWSSTSIVALERRLEVPIRCDDGVERRLTGQPDVLLADPPGGAIVCDYKTGWGVPSEPRHRPSDGVPKGREYLSERGMFQLNVYGLLVMANYSAIERVTLREMFVRTGEVREATLTRDDLEHVEREVGVQMELLERAMRGGPRSPMWKPTPGPACRFCARPSACPVEMDVRIAAGGIATEAEAARAAGQYAVADKVRKGLHEGLKPWVDRHGPIPIGKGHSPYAVGWSENGRGGRRFGLHVVREPGDVEGDESLEAAFNEAADRRGAP